jgi:hypothetical protein
MEVAEVFEDMGGALAEPFASVGVKNKRSPPQLPLVRPFDYSTILRCPLSLPFLPTLEIHTTNFLYPIDGIPDKMIQYRPSLG